MNIGPFPAPLDQPPLDLAREIMGMGGVVAGPPALPFVGFARAGIADDYPTTAENWVQTAKQRALVFCDLTAADSTGGLLSLGATTGGAYHLNATATAWRLTSTDLSGSVQLRTSGVQSPVPVNAGPSFVWASIDTAAGTYRTGHGGSGAMDGVTNYSMTMATGAKSGPVRIFDFGRDIGGRQCSGEICALILDESAGELSAGALNLIGAETTLQGMYSVALAQIALSSATIQTQLVPTATPIATAANFVDNTGTYTTSIVSGTARLTAVSA